jgi:hypothetical protein
MTRPLRTTLVATAIVLSAGASAAAQYGPNAPTPSISGVTAIRPDVTMRPPRSFRDPVPAPRAAEPANPSFEEFWLRFFASVSGYDRQGSASVMSPRRPRAVSKRQVRRTGREVAAGNKPPAH